MSRLLTVLLSLMLPLAAVAQSTTTPVEGSDYVVIPDGKSWQPLNGKIEVVELFAYSCHHCAVFAPMLDAWKRKQPADVRVSYVPVTYDPGDATARSFFAAEELGVLGKTHAQLFHAIHDAGTVPMSNPSVDELAAFYRAQGVDVAKLKATMASPAVDATMARAHDFMLRSDLPGTPTLVVNGKYRVQGRSHEQSLHIAEQLIAMERTAGKQR